MAHSARASHVGSALSCADILAVLYGNVMRHWPAEPQWPDRDRFVMGKGHAAIALYSCLANTGYFPRDLLDTFGKEGTSLSGHVTAGRTPGVEVSSGSLGHGLSQAAGMALALRHQSSTPRVFCLMSDGDCQEGATWEAALLAGTWSLANLHAIVDANGQQGLGAVSDIANLEPLSAKWSAFGWDVQSVDGHDVEGLTVALGRTSSTRPLATIARTVKGRGVSFMEDNLQWHYKAPSDEQLEVALSEIGLP